MESSEKISSFKSRVKQVLGEPGIDNAVTFVSQIYHSDQTRRDHAYILFKFCCENFPNCLTLILLKVCKCSVDDRCMRLMSLGLLLIHLSNLYEKRIQLVPECFGDIKPLLISCFHALETNEGDFKNFSTMASLVALDVYLISYDWFELCDYCTELAQQDLKKALYIFNGLPAMLGKESLMLVVKKLFPLILKCLKTPSCDTEDWILALEGGFLTALQLGRANRKDLESDMMYAILTSSCELLRNGKETTIGRGLWKVTYKVENEAPRFKRNEYTFVSSFIVNMEKMKGLGENSINATRVIHHTLVEKCWDI